MSTMMHPNASVRVEQSIQQALKKGRNKIGTMKAGTMIIIKRMKFAKNITHPHKLNLIS
jgi:DNA integrity scanning protein DisA with diadenylate cyclase activity